MASYPAMVHPGGAPCGANGENSLLLYNGNFFRFDGKKHYNWVWIKNGIIRDAGYQAWDSTHLLESEQTIDLKGNLVLPGFCDCHVHCVPSALDRTKVNLNGSANFAEIGTRLREWLEEHPQSSMVRACLLEVSDLEEKRLPNRRVIDQYVRDLPCWIESRDFHCTILNTKALHVAGVPFLMDGVELDDSQRPTGIFRGKANAFLRRKMADSYQWDEKEQAVTALCGRLLKRGVTSIHAMEGGEGFSESDAEFLAQCGPRLPVDIAIYFGTMDPQRVKSLGLSRIGDIFLDGSFASGNAALSVNYHDRPEKRHPELLPGGAQRLPAQLLSGRTGHLSARCRRACHGAGPSGPRVRPVQNRDLLPAPPHRARRAHHPRPAQAGRRPGAHLLHAARL